MEAALSAGGHTTYRVGADIGGTFTDIVLISSDGELYKRKQPSTPDDYSRGIAEGLSVLMAEHGILSPQITEVVHATTVATNTVLEGKGARTALITTSGFRDVLEIGRVRVSRLYDFDYQKPVPLALRRHRYEVRERIAADGSVVTPLDLSSMGSIVKDLIEEEIEAVAISFLNSHANPAHENGVRAYVAENLPANVYVTASCDVLPEIREYERTSTTVVNAYLGPIVRNYLDALIQRLRGMGINCPTRIMNSAGGLMSVAAASRMPACIIESGPAAGVIACSYIAQRAGYSDVISVDMGGTTAKAAIIENCQPARTTEYEVGAGINVSSKLVKGGGHAVKLPFIDVSEIGAGGGSLVEFDDGGLLMVGPESAGAVPGPVCYDNGNETPTLTDAFVSLGYLNQNEIAGGEVKLNADRARNAIRDKIASPMAITLHGACLGIQEIATATMARAVKAVSTYRGRDPRDFAIVAFGGNGPMIATEIARTMGIRTVIIPPNPGVLSAVGLLFSPIEHEFVASDFRLLSGTDNAQFELGFLDMEQSALATLIGEGYSQEDLSTTRYADLRYEGQAYELTIAVKDGDNALRDAIADFEEEHHRVYGHAAYGNLVELVNRRVKGRVVNRSTGNERPWTIDQGTSEVTNRAAFFSGSEGIEIPVIPRSNLAGLTQQGPMIVEEYDSTLVIPHGASASLDMFGNIIVELGS